MFSFLMITSFGGDSRPFVTADSFMAVTLLNPPGIIESGIVMYWCAPSEIFYIFLVELYDLHYLKIVLVCEKGIFTMAFHGMKVS